MRKLVLLLCTLCILIFCIATMAQGANTYPHGGYTDRTETCGQCHSLHTANGNRLLKGTTIENTCFLCHDGTQSNYNVKKGTFYNGTSEVDSPAGGFDASYGFTSNHLVGQKNFIPGGDSTIFSLACTSCHSPHGTTNHRNLNKTVNGNINVSFIASIAGPGRATTTASGKEVVSYQSGINNFCGISCHKDYTNYYSPDTYGGIERYRHRVSVPLNGGINVNLPDPGLYTSLPTSGAPTGANITGATAVAGGSLAAGTTYNYLITAYNLSGESVRGNIKQVVTNATDKSVSLSWDAVTNAVGYKIYRATGTGAPESIPISNFMLLAQVGDTATNNIVTYTDTGAVTPGGTSPSVTIATTSARVFCLTCHFAHGTKAVDEYYGEGEDPDGPGVQEPNGYGYGYSTYLKRRDNMGVCQDCHKR